MTRLDRSTKSQPLRIAMVAACPFPSPRGSQVLIRELAQALADRGHAVHLVTYPHGESLVPIRGMFVHRVRPWWGTTTRKGLSWWRKLFLDVGLAVTLYRVVRREHIQIIHAHNYEGPLISYAIRRLTGVPVVYHSHNALSDELGYYFKPGWRRAGARFLGRFLDRQIPRRANFAIALTSELEGFLTSHGVAASRVAVVPPGTVPVATLPDPAGGAGDLFADRFVVMYTGNLDPYQDLDVLVGGFIAASSQIERALLVLVTHETNWMRRVDEPLRALVRAGHAHIVSTPAFAVVQRYLARADVLVCPRSSWSGFPIKLINYLAVGRPIVAAEGSAKGVIDGETGLVFRNRDTVDLALALRRLSSDVGLRRRLGDNARAAVGVSYSWKLAVSQIEQIYADVAVQTQPERLPIWSARTARTRGLIGLSIDRISAAAKGPEKMKGRT